MKLLTILALVLTAQFANAQSLHDQREREREQEWEQARINSEQRFYAETGASIVRALKLDPATTQAQKVSSGRRTVYEYELWMVGNYECELRTFGMPGIARLHCIEKSTGATYSQRYLDIDEGAKSQKKAPAKRRKR